MLRTTKHSKTLKEIVPFWLVVAEDACVCDYFPPVSETSVVVIMLDTFSFAD